MPPVTSKISSEETTSPVPATGLSPRDAQKIRDLEAKVSTLEFALAKFQVKPTTQELDDLRLAVRALTDKVAVYDSRKPLTVDNIPSRILGCVEPADIFKAMLGGLVQALVTQGTVDMVRTKPHILEQHMQSVCNYAISTVAYLNSLDLVCEPRKP